MKIELTQTRLSSQYKFEIKINGKIKYRAKANRTVPPLLRKIEITTLEDETIIKLEQKNYWLRLIEHLWIYGCPFILSTDTANVGWIREWFRIGQPIAKAEINKNPYQIYVHKGNEISIHKENIQVGLIRREPWKEWDGDKYFAEYDYDVDKTIAVLLLLFVDIVWFTNDTSINAISKSEYIPVNGIEKDENWTPKKISPIKK